MADGNYFDSREENGLHDAYLMIQSDKTEYECLKDVLLGETIFDEEGLEFWEENVDDV